MDKPALPSQIEVARAYDGLFVPALFGQWTSIVADGARIRPGESVLDVACGTGILAHELTQRVGTAGRVAGIDPGPGMLAVAKDKYPGVNWQGGIAEAIPFDDGLFDAVVCQFGLMFFTDLNAALSDILRVTKPSGRLALAVWDAIENIPAYSAELALIERLGGPNAGAAVRAPFCLGNKDELVGLVEASGAQSVSLSTHRGKARFPSVKVMVEAELRGWLPLMGVHLDEPVIQEILRQAEDELAPYVVQGGAVVFDVTAHLVTARKPRSETLAPF